MREEEIEKVRLDREIQESEKAKTLRAKKMKSIEDLVEEVEVLIEIHFSTNSARQSPRRS